MTLRLESARTARDQSRQRIYQGVERTGESPLDKQESLRVNLDKQENLWVNLDKQENLRVNLLRRLTGESPLDKPEDFRMNLLTNKRYKAA